MQKKVIIMQRYRSNTKSLKAGTATLQGKTATKVINKKLKTNR